MQGHVAAPIDRNIPPRLHLLEQHHLQTLTAAARTPKTDGPIFIAVASYH